MDIFLRSYSPEVRAIALKTRVVIRGVLPTVTEKVYPGWKVIHYSAGQTREDASAESSPQRPGLHPGSAHVAPVFAP